MKITVLNRIPVFFLIISLLLSSCFTEPKANNTNDSLYRNKTGFKTELIDIYFKKLCQTSNFNGGILVAEKGKVIYENVYGYADYEKKDSLKLNSVFQLGSVSKPFTAFAIMKLKQMGKLTYEDSVSKFFPDFPYKNITIKLLLSHRSGLGNYIYFCEKLTDRITPISNTDVIDLMIKHKPEVYFPPNTTFDYCNTNYAILAAIIEKVTNTPFCQFMKKEIFEPLGMKNTYVYEPNQIDTSKNQTKGYHKKWSEAIHVYQDGVAGDKGIYTTLEDLFRFDIELYNNKLVADSILQEAFQPQNAMKKGKPNYGFGWRLSKQENEKLIVFHNGWWRGYNAMFLRMVSDSNTVIILSNVRTKSFYGNYTEILKILDSTISHQDMEIEETK